MNDIMEKIVFYLPFMLYLLSYIAFLYAVKYTVILIRSRKKGMNISNIDAVDNMLEVDFHAYIEVLLKSKGYKLVSQKRDDDYYGADLIMEGEKKILIQAKRIPIKNQVGMSSISAIHSAKSYYNADEAWVFTNAGFGKKSIELARACNVKLIDRKELINMMSKLSAEESPNKVSSRLSKKGRND